MKAIILVLFLMLLAGIVRFWHDDFYFDAGLIGALFIVLLIQVMNLPPETETVGADPNKVSEASETSFFVASGTQTPSATVSTTPGA